MTRLHCCVFALLVGCTSPTTSSPTDPCLEAHGGCDPSAACSSDDAGVRCACPAGFTTQGTACTDVDECAVSNGGCPGTCTNTSGSFRCGCPSGFTNDAGVCTDVDECAVQNGGCAGVCTNTPGSFVCSCAAGFAEHGGVCIDIDECLTRNGGCATRATCTNTPGGRTCACPAGFAGDGLTCADIDECLVQNGGCDLTQPCVNLPGSSTCGACAETPTVLDLDTPLATGRPGYATTTGLLTPSATLWASTAAPLPTDTSWQNLVLNAGGSRVDFLPYQIKAEQAWLDVAAAAPVTTATLVTVPNRRQLAFGAAQFDASTTHQVTGSDLLGVTLRYSVAAGTMITPLIYGMPYVTADYVGLRPVLRPGDFTFTQVNGSSTPGTVSGTRFTLLLSDGTTWLLYASSSITLTWSTTQLAASANFTGTLRVAVQPTPADAVVLDAHAGAIARSGTVSVSVACDVATLRFSWTTTGTGPLLMASMPHHAARLVSPTLTTLTWPTMSGSLLALEGASWTMTIPLSPIMWTAPRPIDPARVAAVRAALVADSVYVPDAFTADQDPYFGGKHLAKLARLILIADELGETTTAAALRARLAPKVAAWLDGTNGNPLRYDTTWGGVITTQSLAGPLAQFGQGHYNDHHFHYGYHLYAAAVLARADPAFAAAHRSGLLALVRDIANPSSRDPDFPRFRHLDFFRSHSWAGGLEDHPDGQDQESSSEAFNAWYGVRLVGLALGDRRISDLGRLLAALEADGARTYYQITSSSSVYQAPFAANRCVGRLFQTMATYDTFFGTEPWKVYGIQILPVTPLSETLINPTWVADAWPVMSASISGANPGFQDLLSMAHATSDSAAAWTELNALNAWDDGDSRTNALWWAATRP